MKQVFVLLLLWVCRDCSGSKIIVKRFANDQNTTSDDSFQVNVSAGYGVAENSTLTTTPQTFEIQERAVIEEKKTTVPNLQDQISQPSQNFNEILPSPSYQVHEKSSEVQDKHFHVKKNHRYRSVEKRVRPKIVKDVEHKDNRVQPSGTKIVEVLRVPAIYELHLQSDPQRLVSLNPLVNKLNSMGNQKYQYKRQYYSYNGKNLVPQQSQVYNTYLQPRPQPVPQNPKPRLINQRHVYSQVKQPQPQHYKYQQVPVRSHVEVKKPEITTSVAPPVIISNEIPSDYYQKPQALHEVPAPVLNRQPQRPVLPTPPKPTSVPNLVYGKTVDNPYHPNQPIITPAPAWNNQYQEPTNQVNQVDPNYYKQYYQNYPQQIHAQQDYYQQPQQQDYYQQQQQQQQQPNNAYYQQPQKVFSGNDAIADYLDSNLVNVNGDVATYLNEDGIMTVSNFHHNPKLYKPPMEYDAPAPMKEDVGAQFNGLMTYQNAQDLTNYDSPVYNNGYSQEIPVNEPVNEPPNQSLNYLLDSAKASLEEHKFEPNFTKRMSPKQFNRRMEPLDYILYIKERRLD